MTGRGHRAGVASLAGACGLSLILVAVVLPSSGLVQDSRELRRDSDTPEYYLWAWRRPEDLSFIDPDRERIAVWTATIFIEDGETKVERRTTPVSYPVGTELVAVIRLEVAGTYGARMAKSTARLVRESGAGFGPVEYQVDFDAVYSQRAFYAMLLEELNELIGEAALSITALASWCMSDNWIGSLPIEAAVPMLYRMGPDRESVAARLRDERGFVEPMCAGNVGYSGDEELLPVDGIERVFLFHPMPWTLERFRTLVERVEVSR